MEDIYYRKTGSGRPVVFLHGFCETHEIWNALTEKPSENIEFYILDLPGFGRSTPVPGFFSIKDIGLRIVRWMEEMKIHHPVVIGHSLGGYIALAIASNFPERIEGLILFHSTAYPDSEERKSNRDRVIDFVKTNGVEAFVDTFVPGLFFDKKNPAIPHIIELARKTSRSTLLGYTAAMRDRPSYVHFLRNFDKPVLILAGANDGIIPKEVSIELSELNSNIILQLFEKTGHMAMLECPEMSQQAILDFIRTIKKDF